MKPLDKTELKEIATLGFADPVFFCQFFFPHWFPDTVPWVHRGLMALLTRRVDFLLKYGELDKIISHFVWREDPDDSQSPEHPIFSLDNGNIRMEVNRFNLVMMPRGFSKTTTANAIVIYFIVYQLHKFIVYLAESGTHASMQLVNVRDELELNERLVSVFGTLKPDPTSGKRWTHDFIQTTTGVSLAARGRGAQVRGLNKGGARPSFIYGDDIEDEESVATEEQRSKTLRWLYKAVIPALPRRDENASLLLTGTLLHRESMLARAQRDPRFNSVVFGAIDRNEEMLWPQQMSAEQYEAEKRSYAAQGELSAFYMEYHNQIRSDETAKFRRNMFIYESPTPEFLAKTHRALVIDPAISESIRADYCSLAVAAMSESGRIYVLESCGKVGMSPREQVDLYFTLWNRWRPQRAGVEAIAYQTALVHLLREEMFRKKTYFEIDEIKHSPRQRKVERVEGILQPRYANGYIIHARRFPELEEQLLDWPNGKKDFPDALAMAVALLDPYAAQAADPSFDLGADEYDSPIEGLIGDWRAAP